jgi:hypothetical protein
LVVEAAGLSIPVPLGECNWKGGPPGEMRAADRRMGLRIDPRIDLCQKEVEVFLALTKSVRREREKYRRYKMRDDTKTRRGEREHRKKG